MRGTIRLTGDVQPATGAQLEEPKGDADKQSPVQAADQPAEHTRESARSFITSYAPELIRLLLAVLISVAATTYIMTTFFYKPVVVLDLTSLVNTARQASLAIKDDQQRVDYVANYFQEISNDLKKRREIVIIKEAVLNPDRLKDITEDYKKQITPQKTEQTEKAQ